MYTKQKPEKINYNRCAFIYDNCRDSKGVDINLLYKFVHGYSKGVNITGFMNIFYKDSKGISISLLNGATSKYDGVNIGGGNIVQGHSRGLNMSFVFNMLENGNSGINISTANILKADSKGVNIALLCNYNTNSKGVNISTGNIFEKDSTGINIGVIANHVEGYSKGINVGGLWNHSDNVKDFLIQYATFRNEVREENPDAFILNIGLWNEIGSKHHPFVQVYGAKNLPRLIKNAFKRNPKKGGK